MHIRIRWVLLLLAAVGTQPVLSADLKFVDGDGKEVPCGSVSELTVTSTEVTAMGTEACLSLTGSTGTDTPVAAAHDLGTVNTNSSIKKTLTDGAIVKLPLPLNPLSRVDGPSLPGAVVGIDGSSAIYYAPSFEQITGSADDSFTYTVTDATGAVSRVAKVDVHVNWIDQSDGCQPTSTIVCMGELPNWPVTHDTTSYILEEGYTHVWTFTYATEHTGQLGATLSPGYKDLKISKLSGDTQAEATGCWVQNNEYVYYEPEPGTNPYKCDLKVGQQYYFNIKNQDALTKYHLTGL